MIDNKTYFNEKIDTFFAIKMVKCRNISFGNIRK